MDLGTSEEWITDFNELDEDLSNVSECAVVVGVRVKGFLILLNGW